MTGYPSIDKPWMKYYKVEGADTTPPAVAIYEYLCEKKERELIAISYYGKEISYKEFFSILTRQQAFFTPSVSELRTG